MELLDLVNFFRQPRVAINLMYEKTSENDPFYAYAVRRFYEDAVSPHPKLPFIAQKYQYGFAVCKLPTFFADYFEALDSTARRNYRKAQRQKLEFRRFDFNAYRDDISEIWRSAPVRQGQMPLEKVLGNVPIIPDPPSRTPYHDYPYFGVFQENQLVAYAGCLIAGELCHLNDLYGHAAYLEQCVVPFAIVETARVLQASYPNVRYYAYGTYFGGHEGMRRFKLKFNFAPHHVRWVLSGSEESAILQSPSTVGP